MKHQAGRAETVRLTRIENMPEERRKFIEDLLRQRPRPSGQKIAALYNEKYPPKLTGQPDLDASTVYSHLKLRMQEVLDEIRRRKVEYAAQIEMIGEKGLDEAAQANIWEALQTMSPGQLILLRSVETKRKELELKEKAQATRNQELELKVKQFQTQQEQGKKAVEEASEKLGKGESLTVEDINRIRERTFGLPPEAAAGHPA